MTMKLLRGLELNMLEAARPIQDRQHQGMVKFVNHGGIAIINMQGVAISKTYLRQKETLFEYLWLLQSRKADGTAV